ncbi:coiled-coil domain-containing protein 73-like [Myxocyprinus asiaticus]|uniref:coiled-coil domain-containing protein 73-like n=1 Tax=Myxocyprinus asiaticus TaxID=70543 RepID=UPI0022212FAD|nr:coiled-coil domain-containing protein 73-like [Myxocyprinus asiaticus]
MEDKEALGQPKTPNIAFENDGRTISVQVLEFKTSLLEAIEELHIHRDAETRYEEQIFKLVLEKQELEWQKESLQSQISRMSNESSESLTAVKKQFQAQIRRIEGEKGKYQLAAELKDKEITSLKEELKLLQLLRYSLEKKLSELEQKLQLQTQTKDSHLNQLAEAERRFGAISRQCAMVKQAHEKLEQNVEESMQINKKLTSINKKQESTINALKEDVERLNKELVTSKVSSVCKPGEEHLQNILKEQQLQQLQQKLLVETELNKKLRNETAKERAEKQGVLRSLHHTQHLLQTQTEALSRAEQELRTLQEGYLVLKTEHVLNQERTKEKEDSFAHLRDVYQNSKLAWEKEMLLQKNTMEADQFELKTVKEAYNQLQEENKQLSISAAHIAKEVHNCEVDLKDQESQNQENSVSTPESEINLVTVGSLHKDVSTELEERLISPHDNCEPSSHPIKAIPDESTAECQKAIKAICSHDNNKELNVPMQVDGAVPEQSPTEGSDILDSNVSDIKISRPEEVSSMTDQLSNLCAETKAGVNESEPVCNTVDKGCPLNPVRSDTDNCLTELSGPETRSVYGVDSDPLALEPKDRALEQSLCIPKVTESQTSDKHTDSQGCATSQDTESKEIKDQTAAPEIFHSLSQNESQTKTEILLKDRNVNSDQQNTTVFCVKTPSTEGLITTQPSPYHETVHQELENTLDRAFTSATIPLDSHLNEYKDQLSLHEMACAPSQSRISQAEASTETCLPDGVNEMEPKSLLLVTGTQESYSQTTVIAAVDTVEAISENNDQKDDDCSFYSSTQTLKAQQSEVALPSKAVSLHPQITIQEQDPSSIDRLPKANDQSDVDQKCISMADASNHAGNKGYRSSFTWGTFMKRKRDPQPESTDNEDPSVVSRNSQPYMTLISTPSNSEQMSSGFHELASTFCVPLFMNDKLTKRVLTKTTDRRDTPSKHPHQKSNCRGEWNAIKQSISEILAEKENQVLIAYSSTLSGSPASSNVGNRLRQDCTPTISLPKLHSQEREIRNVTKGGTLNSEGKEERKPSDIMAQIAKIEEFMSSEGLTPQKRPKID